MKKNPLTLLLIFAPVFLLLSCSPPPPETPKNTVTLQLKWMHQGQFAGFYMAKQKGYYAAENIEATFLEGGKDVNMFEGLHTGKADFAIVSGESILSEHVENTGVKAVAVIYQRSPVVFVAQTGSNITRPQDFIGKVIAVSGLEKGGLSEALIQFKALMNRMGLQPHDYRLAPYDPLFHDFLSGKVDVTPVYLGNGAVKLRELGLSLNIVWPGDYGIPFYSDTLATTSAYLEKNPDLALRFVRASMRGWKDVVENADAAVEATMQYAPNSNPRLQRKMIDAQMPLVHTGEHPLGWMEPKIWYSMHRTLVEHNLLEGPLPDVDAVYTLDLLNAYGQPAKQ